MANSNISPNVSETLLPLNDKFYDIVFKNSGSEVRTWVEILTVTYTCVISGGQDTYSETQFPHLKNEDDSLSHNCCEH